MPTNPPPIDPPVPLTQWRSLPNSDVVTRAETTAGVVSVRGPDAHDFLQRMSTNAVTGRSQPEQGFLNCFVDKRGRMVDLVHQLAASPTEARLIAERDAAALATFLSGFLFMEEAELGVDDAIALTRVVGQGAAAFLAQHLNLEVQRLEPSSSLVGPNQIVTRSFDYAGPDGTPVPTFLVGGEATTEVVASLPLLALDVAAAARIAAGVVAPPVELSDAHNPLELALHDALDWKKGCYIGQEVIARIDNYNKQARRVVGVKLSADHIGAALKTGTAFVDADGKERGRLLSVAPRGCRSASVPAALALAKVGPLEAPMEMKIESDDGPISVHLVRRTAEQTPHD